MVKLTQQTRATREEEVRRLSEQALEKHARSNALRKSEADLKSSIQTMKATTKKELEEIAEAAKTHITDASGELKTEVDGSVEKFDRITEAALSAGERIWSLEKIAIFYDFLGTGKGDPGVIYPLVASFLVRLREWGPGNGMPYHTEIDSLFNRVKDAWISTSTK